jgi:hypothetical protein
MIMVFLAKKIITMDPSNPLATHVAVKDGKILGVGELEDLEKWGEYELNTIFKDKVMMPGLVEGHAHTMEGTLWRHVYCGFFDRTDPDGRSWSGAKNLDSILERLKIAEKALTDPETPLSVFEIAGASLIIVSRKQKDLDKVSKIIKKFKSKCVSYACDVTNYNQIKNIINKQKKIDILVNNAGTNIPEHFINVQKYVYTKETMRYFC